ncbi:TPA: hypothetical protein LUX59_004856 [Enterobacter hormaechei subsp. xiangfangensis]|nr:hypothetical protein [Enterobacter hormaechei subsp. xiangfangensis]
MDEGLTRAISNLKTIMIREEASSMWWA